jgi:hypothetical protein
MSKASSLTILRWYQMTSIRNCKKLNNCKCADRLRKITLKKPINAYEELQIDKEIEIEKNKYKNCFHKNKIEKKNTI